MKLFSFKKKKDVAPAPAGCGCGCGCGSNAVETPPSQTYTAGSVKVLGSGCQNCNDLEVAVAEALAELNMDPTVIHVTDFTEIAKYGVMSTPALVVDETVVSMGKTLKKDEVLSILKKIRR